MKSLVITPDPGKEFYSDERCWILESWYDETVSIARVRVEPGVTTVLHRLKGVDECYLITEGTGNVEIGDLPSRTVKPGDVAVIPAGTPQRISNTGKTDLVFFCICAPRFTPECYEDLEASDDQT
jgi:mannose-6-phosphate isomerase-like protein (cupin superfamily)